MSDTFVRRTRLLAASALVGAVLLLAPAARAQDPSAQPSPSLGTTSDSAATLAELDVAVRRNPKDAVAWHRKGLIAWGMVRSRRSGSFMANQADINLVRNADSSLRIAVREAPDSGRYALDLARFYLNSDLVSLRLMAGGLEEQAYAAAARVHDLATMADARDESGMTAWRQYESFADRVDTRVDLPTITAVMLDQYAYDARGLRSLVETLTHTNAGAFTGEADYRRAEAAFTSALVADPEAVRPRRHLYMAMAERGRWEELRQAAATRTAQAPTEPDSWLALGLAMHRLGQDDSANVALETGLRRLAPGDRERYTRFTRLLVPRAAGKGGIDSVRFVSAPEATRQYVERAYWAGVDPMSLTTVNERRVEYLSRVVYSELRWTSEDLDLHGADSDRGEIYTRYGPPMIVLGFGPNGKGNNTVAWYYRHGMTFVFNTPPSFGSARLSTGSRSMAEQARVAAPVLWDEDPNAVRPDSVRVQIARFRAGPDSADLLVAAAVPVDSLIRNVTRGHASVDVGFTLLAPGGAAALRDSSRDEVAPEDAAVAGARSWRGRVHSGDYVFRVEGAGVASRRTARGSGAMSTHASAGFGTSDVVVASKVDPIQGAAGERWTDYVILPNAGVFAKGAPVSLLWETYALGTSGGGTRYTVTVNVSREARGGVSGFAARAVAGVAGVVGRNSTSTADGRVTLSYERRGPARPVTTDYLTLDLGDAPAGSYLARVTVRDAATGKESTTSSRFTIGG